jgi:hypothetical protein
MDGSSGSKIYWLGVLLKVTWLLVVSADWIMHFVSYRKELKFKMMII